MSKKTRKVGISVTIGNEALEKAEKLVNSGKYKNFSNLVNTAILEL